LRNSCRAFVGNRGITMRFVGQSNARALGPHLSVLVRLGYRGRIQNSGVRSGTVVIAGFGKTGCDPPLLSGRPVSVSPARRSLALARTARRRKRAGRHRTANRRSVAVMVHQGESAKDRMHQGRAKAYEQNPNPPQRAPSESVAFRKPPGRGGMKKLLWATFALPLNELALS
jgi:hypothetical protein